MSGRGPIREEGGQAIVLFATALPLFLVLLLLVIDGGRLLVERERLRNAAHFAAEAAVSLAGDRDDRLPTDAEARRMVDTAVRLNLPGLPTVRAESVITSGRLGVSPYQVRVRVTEQFATSIQQLTFTIAAEAAAQLGQTTTPQPPPAQPQAPQPPSAAAVPQPPPPAAPQPVARSCFQVWVGGSYLNQSNAAIQKMIDGITQTIDGAGVPVFAAPGSRHSYVAAAPGAPSPNALTDGFTLPATLQAFWSGQTRTIFVSGVAVSQTPSAIRVADPRCP